VTTARALAYMNGPDKLDPKKAMLEAKSDRRKKARRKTSYGASQPASNSDGSSTVRGTDKDLKNTVKDAKDNVKQTVKDVVGVVVDKTDHVAAAATKQNDSTAVISTSDENGDVVLAEPSAHTTKEATGDTAGKTGERKKKFRRPKWTWSSRRRNESKSKANVADRDSASGETSAAEKKPTNASGSSGTVTAETKQPAVTVDEQKDLTGPAPVQMARAA
jgi:hypothetical protein